ncbi:peptidyl-prolyl cis-trans isomerase [Luteolibacter marinus]|uniref:peptidylprolyl isomerase n=1 Tax=Luteolibacter marinus TaxID=2776705 RepID=UPI001865EAEA|nr:peptidylprolyl isomerase [Luteolibacter marinus]
MKILKEPLLHFVLIGALIFALYQRFDPEAEAPGETEVVVTSGRIQQLSAIFQKTWQRPPTRDELQGLVDDFILEEIYYREATAAGLDHNDTLIRRRLRQKMEFLTDDLAAGTPGDEELAEFVEANPERFRKPPATTFRQIFFNPDKLGDQRDQIIADAAAELAKGEVPEGHPTLLPPDMSGATPKRVTATFGEEFAGALAGLEVGKWSEPIRSGFGIHFVRVDDRTDAELPPLGEIRPVVLREWEHEQREAFRDRFQSELLKKYEVTVEWPATNTPKG